MHVAPGDTSDIAVAFDTHFQKGHQVRTITASTNDPDNPQVAMTMQGIVKKQVEAVPGEVAFGDVKRGTEGTKEMLVNDLNPGRGDVLSRPGQQLELVDQGGSGEASRRQARRAAESLAAQDDADRPVRRHDQNHDQSRAAAG